VIVQTIDVLRVRVRVKVWNGSMYHKLSSYTKWYIVIVCPDI